MALSCAKSLIAAGSGKQEAGFAGILKVTMCFPNNKNSMSTANLFHQLLMLVSAFPGCSLSQPGANVVRTEPRCWCRTYGFKWKLWFPAFSPAWEALWGSTAGPALRVAAVAQDGPVSHSRPPISNSYMRKEAETCLTRGIEGK